MASGIEVEADIDYAEEGQEDIVGNLDEKGTVMGKFCCLDLEVEYLPLDQICLPDYVAAYLQLDQTYLLRVVDHAKALVFEKPIFDWVTFDYHNVAPHYYYYYYYYSPAE